jgi:hypothetical protein
MENPSNNAEPVSAANEIRRLGHGSWIKRANIRIPVTTPETFLMQWRYFRMR